MRVAISITKSIVWLSNRQVTISKSMVIMGLLLEIIAYRSGKLAGGASGARSANASLER